MNKLYIQLVTMLIISASCGRKEIKITELQDLNDKRIYVLTGSAGDLMTRERFPDADIVDIETATDAAYNVKMGNADAFIFDYEVLHSIEEKYADLVLLQEPAAKVDIAIAFEKQQKQLSDEVNRALQQLEKDGTIAAMNSKWINPGYEEVPELPAIDPEKFEETLKVGISADAEPMMFAANNIITGFDMELILRIAKIFEKDVEIVNMDFGTLIMALQSGKIDFAISNFNITKERKEFVRFSEPYLKQDISVLVRK
jgi:polar amino acid transport system substrate-binding protein